MQDLPLAVTSRLATAMLNKRGQLPDFDLTDCLFRGSLLVDLAARGKLVQLETELEIDTQPTHVPLVDSVLNEVASSPGLNVQAQIEFGRIGGSDVSHFLVQGGHWAKFRTFLRGAKYDPIDSDLVAFRKMSPNEIRSADPTVWCLMRSGGGVTRPPSRPPQRDIDGAGDVAWILETVVDTLLDVHRRNEQTGWALRLS